MGLKTTIDQPHGPGDRPAAERFKANAEGQAETVPRVAVATNGSPQSVDALMLGALIARSTDAKLIVACVFPPESLAGTSYEPRGARVAMDDHRIFVRQDAAAVLAEARAALPDDLDVAYHALGYESPQHGLRHLAVSESIDLLVLGSSHRGRVGQLLPLGVARRLLRRSRCALAVAPRGFRHRQRAALRRLVVAHDRSPVSERALDAAAGLAVRVAASSSASTDLRVFQVAAKASSAFSRSETELAAQTDIDERIAKLATVGGMADSRDRGARLEIYTSATLAGSDPTAGLIDITTDEADCLVIGWPRHKRAGRRGLLRRARLLRRAACPVLFVPTGVRSPFLSDSASRRLGRPACEPTLAVVTSAGGGRGIGVTKRCAPRVLRYATPGDSRRATDG
jgi:nucleotide-binding universal stress UspA family protein